jgi:hypothetical protein
VVTLAVVGTVAHIVAVRGYLSSVVVHVPAPSMRHLAWTAPRTGDTGLGGSGVGGSPAWMTHQLSVQPGPGAMWRAKDVAVGVGNDANHDHVPVHVSHYPEQSREEAR